MPILFEHTAVADAIRTSLGPRGMDKMVRMWDGIRVCTQRVCTCGVYMHSVCMITCCVSYETYAASYSRSRVPVGM